MRLTVSALAFASASASDRVAILHGTDGETHSYVTTDGGASWRTTHLPFEGRGVCSYKDTLYAVGFKEDPPGDFSGFAGVSTDGGASWNATKLPALVDVCTASSPTTMVATGGNGYILRTTDGGQEYETLFETYDNHDTFTAVVAVPGTLLVTGRFENPNVADMPEVLVASDDAKGAHHWSNLTGSWLQNNDYTVTTAVACPGAVFAGDDDGNYYYSTDPTARKWSDKLFIGHTMRVSSAACVGDSDVWAVQYEGNAGTALLCPSHDSGKTFEKCVDLTMSKVKPLSLLGFAANKRVLYATAASDGGRGTESKLYRSENAGADWKEVQLK